MRNVYVADTLSGLYCGLTGTQIVLCKMKAKRLLKLYTQTQTNPSEWRE